MTSVQTRARRFLPNNARNAILTCSVVLAILLAGATTFLVLRLHATALASAAGSLDGMSLVLAEQANQTFDSVEIVATGVEDRLRISNTHTPDEFRERMTGIEVYQELGNRIRGMPQIDAITVIDAAGEVTNFSRFWPAPPMNVAGRDYFKALRDDPALINFIATPTPNGRDNTATVYLAHRVAAPDGTFLGVIVASVDLTYFQRLYAAVMPDPSNSIALLTADGALLTRFPPLGPATDEILDARRSFAKLVASRANGVAFEERNMGDGQKSLIAGRALKRYRLHVRVAIATARVFADWRDSAIYLIGATILLELFNAGAATLLLRHLRHQALLERANATSAEAELACRAAEAELALSRQRERAEVEMHMRDVRFRVAVNNMSQALCMFDLNDRLVVANPQMSRMFAIPDGVLRAAMTFDEVLAAARARSNVSEDDIDALARGFRDVKEAAAHVYRVRELADSRSVATTYQPVEDHGWLITIEDVTQQRAAAAKIAYMAHHDALTGLPNRLLFHERLEDALAQTRRGERRALLCLDLDHFKSVNDSLGHPVGDALLRAVTLRLRNTVRETDTVARLGGDEFAVIQAHVDNVDDTNALARRIIEALSSPYEVSGHSMAIGVSIGIARIPDDGDNADDLLRNGDMALYRAKADGRGCCRLFEPEMDAIMQARRMLELDLRNALVTGEFEVFYQPLMDLRTLAITSCEALLRWRHAERGLIPPARFVGVAEEIGLIVPLGLWVLRRACVDATSWPEDIKVNVNLSVIQFGSRTLVSDVAAALMDSGLAPHRLVLEITETLMLEDTEATLTILHQLRGLGVSIAMDDFGTGYSSLSYLRRFPFDKVKIDRSFIEGLGEGGDSDAILAAVTDLCETLGIKTTAEGVETKAQLDILRNGKCTDAQGYLFSKAVPAAELAALMRSKPQSRALSMPAGDERIPLPALT